MPTTTKRGYRYPAQSAEPDAAGDVQRLSEDVDADMDATLAALGKLPGRIQTGAGSISITTNQTSVTQTVTFPVAFPGGATLPNVFLQLTANVAGRASQLTLYVNNTTATNFVVKMQTSDNATIGTNYTIAYNWVAFL